ncbi:phospholipase D-like domain-containing protein [Arcobacter sp. YIC-80]|uniref:phospholipase D-like domain-containing protein n=1 Tax=Arcobacter sp. YIC-80 TaxID=3376683 RepID=UPI00384E9876
MMKNSIVLKCLVLLVLVNGFAFSKDAFELKNTNEIYFLPKHADKTKDKIIDLIKQSKDSIYISMYNFSYKKFAKQLVEKSKEKTKITVIFDKSKVKKDDKIYKLLEKNGIKTIIADKKLHTKIAIFDEKILVLGSTNWTKDSFKDNYEVILFTRDNKIIQKSKSFIKKFD